jgi:hypothetical protein
MSSPEKKTEPIIIYYVQTPFFSPPLIVFGAKKRYNQYMEKTPKSFS